MKLAVLLLSLFFPLLAAAGPAVPTWQEQPKWASEFARRGVAGTALIFDERAGRWLVFDRNRAATPFSPASTFKLFNALVALDTGAVGDEYEVIRWDGVKRQYDTWNRDHSLASALKLSAVWFYQEIARRAGAARMQAWIDKAAYGNRDIGGGIDQFWLSGNLRISALEQVGFLRRLADGDLPFSVRAQETVRRIAIVESAPDFVLHAKTGWAVRDDSARAADLGWYVGWLERGGRRWFFAINIDMPQGAKDAAQRGPLARALLRDLGALPTEGQ
jgi:beta-lactamase class D